MHPPCHCYRFKQSDWLALVRRVFGFVRAAVESTLVTQTLIDYQLHGERDVCECGGVTEKPWRAALRCRRTWTAGAWWRSGCFRWCEWRQTHTGPRSVNMWHWQSVGRLSFHCCCFCFTFSPLALLMARSGLSTRSTLRIFTTDMALELEDVDIVRVWPKKPPAESELSWSTHWRKKDVSDTLTTSRSRRLKAFLQKEPVWRNAP